MSHPAPAPVGRRLLAYVIDQAAAVVCGGGLVIAVVVPRLVGAVRGGTMRGASVPGGLVATAWVLLTVLALVQWWALATYGWTLGKWALGLRLVDVRTGRPVGLVRTALRVLVVAAGSVVCGVGQLVVLLSPLFDPQDRRRGWHDKAARAELVDLSTGTLPTPRRPRAAAPGHGLQVVVGPEPRAPRVAGRPEWAGPEPGVRSPVRAAGDPTDAVAGDVVARRLGALLSDRSAPGHALELAPFPAPGVSPDVDTRAMPILRQPTSGLDPRLEDTRRAPLRAAERIASGPPADPATADLELSDGRVVTVAKVALVGRNPSADTDVQLVRIVDPGRSVSKTHLQVGVDGAVVWVADRGSTNGTLVTLDDGQQIVCGAGQRVRVPVGAIVSFGDCNLTVIRTPSVEAREA